MDIIILPFHDYKKWTNEGFRTRDAHLYEHLKRNSDIDKILIINRPVSLLEMIIKKQNWCIKSNNIFYKEQSLQITQIDEKTFCLDIFIPDFLRVIKEKKQWWFSCFNYPKVVNGINKSLKLLKFKDSILLLQNPMAISIVRKIENRIFVFDAIDNWAVHPQMKQNRDLILKNYSYVDHNADLILTVSQNLLNIFPNNKNKHWVANGVDIDYFAHAVKPNFSQKITIGYVGKIQERVDFDLIEKCLQKLPNFQFLFLGPLYAQKRKARELTKHYKNIKFLGDIHYLDLPNAMQDIDIAIIPHKIDSFTSSMNPLKLYEYLAAGKPVVSTKVAGVNSISQYVFEANTPAEFITLIEKVSKELYTTITAEKIISSINPDVTWSNRTNAIISLFHDTYRNKLSQENK
ncbi:glycosyltransferase, group 1 family protein [Phocaeicola plebeius DSM 17135]|uniref:Glycosyltransferase, group 1 family protein n=1 Tax=Phocaeicola plebeius (strain DSM 17135 / JCM 12973 / CCUG 54634 / M2) TaxID=484018 RepID=B5CWS1_PHOPM|nr:glycosyltransferase [Phocaeicola plebeius]EDY96718.1 glycosyltransferase, group 1 family protein [Phocaeicola plebeius DSM 17135]